MKRLILVSIALAMILGSGYAVGVQTHRWGKAEAVRQAVERMAAIPTQFGDWDSTQAPIPPQQLLVAEAQGSYSQQFVNRETGESLSVMILCGEHGPISLHPPTVCFVGAGWHMPGETSLKTVTDAEGNAAEFQVSHFTRIENGVPQMIRTWWSWSADGTWQAPDDPRFSFAGTPSLYKMYVVTPIASTDATSEDEPTEDFLREFLPLLFAALHQTDSAP